MGVYMACAGESRGILGLVLPVPGEQFGDCYAQEADVARRLTRRQIPLFTWYHSPDPAFGMLHVPIPSGDKMQ